MRKTPPLLLRLPLRVRPLGPARPAPALSAEQASYLFGLTLGEQLHGIGIADVQVDAVGAA